MSKIIAERPKLTVVGMVCDRCKKVYAEDEIHEFLSWSMRCGYGNITFGDMSKVELDLCQYCTKEVLGEWIRVYTPLSEVELIEALTSDRNPKEEDKY